MSKLAVSKQSAEVKSKRKAKSKIREYTEALVIALLLALILRSFVIEAFKVPSGSMLPSILIGDYLFVNKFAYGLRLPLSKKWLAPFDEPKRGEVIVFRYPKDESKDYIKRVVGLPGDHIAMTGKQLTINGKKAHLSETTVKVDNGTLTITPIKSSNMQTDYKVTAFPNWQSFEYYVEQLGEVSHLVQYDAIRLPQELHITVPTGNLFVMGDNRDHSSDSRVWGFVPLENLKGHAMFTWLSLDYENIGVRWHRFGHWIE